MGTLYTVDGIVNSFSHCGKLYGVFSRNNKKIELPYDPTVLVLAVYTQKTKTLI